MVMTENCRGVPPGLGVFGAAFLPSFSQCIINVSHAELRVSPAPLRSERRRALHCYPSVFAKHRYGIR
jgi:hypothetical protein